MNLKKKLLNCLFTGTYAPWLTEVEWLENPISQANSINPYIDTGILPSWDVPFEMTATITKTSNNRIILLGNYSGNLTNFIEVTEEGRLRIYITASTSIDPAYIARSFYTDASTPIPLNVPTKIWVKYIPLNDADHTIKYEMGFESLLDSSVNATDTGSFYRYGSPTSIRTLRIFIDYRSLPASSFNGGFKLHQLEIKHGTINRIYVACLDKENIPCMYEQVEGKLYYNGGVGNFNSGRHITEVEWINLTGNQRFNTGFKPNTLSTTLKATFQLTGDDSLSRFPFGCRKQTGQTDTCTIYIAPSTSTNPNGYLRLDWPFQASNPRYSIVSSTEKITLEITGNYSNINGEINTSSNVTSYDQTAPFYIGNCYTSSASGFQSAFIGKFYVVNLLNTYSRDDYRYCVPAHDENNVGFFFDRTNHFIMDNEGSNTQDMTWGDEIHSVGYIYGGYPSSFKTLGTTFAAHKWETDMKAAGNNDSQILLGSATGAANYWGVSSTANAYMLHTTSTSYWIYMDAKQRRTVCLDSNDLGNSKGTLTMDVDGQTMSRTATSAFNTSTAYNLFYFNSNYTGKMWLYGNRCYDRTTNKLLLNWVPVQNGDKVCKFLETITHTLIDAVSYPEELTPGYNMIGYQMGNELPYGFAPLNYLESTGSQWVDTGIYMNSDYGVEIEARQTSATQSVGRYLFGDAPAQNTRYLIAVTPGNDTYRFGLENANKDSNISAYDGKWHTHKVVNKTYYIDGVSQGALSVTDFTAGRSSRLFSVQTTGTLTENYWQVRSCKQYDNNGRIIAHLIPALRTYDNKPGMYDLINRKFLTNGGTVEFEYA